MNINFNYLDNTISFSDERIFVLEITNKYYFYRIVNDLNLLSKGIIKNDIRAYNNQNQELNISNKINIIIDYFNIDFNTKNITSQLNKSIKNLLDEEDKDKINYYYNKIISRISKKLIEFDIPLSINETYDIDNIIKLLKITLNSNERILENLFLIIDIENTFKINDLIIFINLKQYLTKEELIEFYKYCMYHNVKILLIDSQNYEIIKEIEKKIIIDSDLEEFII